MPTPPDCQLPGWATRLLTWLCADHNREIVIGDFAETYTDIASAQGPRRALVWYAWQLVRSLPSFLLQRYYFGGFMIGAYTISAMRNLRKRKFFSAINIAGLAIGMATCILIFQYVAFESSYDTFHEHQDDLYRVVVDGEGGGEARSGKTWRALRSAMEEQLPDIVQAARVHSNNTATITRRPDQGKPDIYKQEGGLFVDPNFFDIFGFQMQRGNASEALSSTDQMLVSASMARKYFGDTDPIGKTLEIVGWTTGTFTVAGVFEDPPARSHLAFDYLLPIRNLELLAQYKENAGWQWQNFTTYVQLRPGADPGKLSPLLQGILKTNIAHAFEVSPGLRASLQPVTEIHLLPNGKPGIQVTQIYFFGIVGIFVLLIAWINFINLSTARAIERAKEVGVRKTIGATKGNLVAQFLVEALLTNGLALIIAVALSIVSVPYLEVFTGVELSLAIWLEPRLWLSLFGLLSVGVLLSCLYPAFVLSSSKPMSVLKSQPNSLQGGLRRSLVILQFSVSALLLIGTVAVFTQLEYMRNSDLGLSLNQILVVEPPIRADRHGASDVFKGELAQIPEIQFVSSGAVPGSGFFMDMPARKLEDDITDTRPLQAVFVDESFLDTYDLNVVAGRNFIDAASDGLGTVLNEEGVRIFGFASNEEAIGRRVVFNAEGNNYVTVIGVVEDFNWMSVKEKVGAIGFLINNSEGPFSLKVSRSNIPKTLAAVQAAFEKVYPSSPFSYFFADEYFNEQYKAEQRFGLLFGVFTLLALLVACLGLIGLTAYMVSQRTKEIGIRKIVGASTRTIAQLLLSDFTRLLVIALVIAVPIAYYGLSLWLDGYASHINMTVTLFLYPSLAIFTIALLAVSYHSLRATLINPVIALKSE